MSTQVLPALNYGWSVHRTPEWGTRKHEAISGKETAIQDRVYPRYTWDYTCEILRQGNIAGVSWTEMAQLLAFFNNRGGGADSFLITDNHDNSVANQAIVNTATGGTTGDGTTKTFQLYKTFQGFTEPCFAPNVVTHLYDNGVDPGGWSVSNWGTTTPGVVTFAVAPAAGHPVTATFTYYFPVRFVDDTMDFEEFMQGYFAVKKFSVKSLPGL